MWGRKKGQEPATNEIADLDGQVEVLRGAAATGGTPEVVGRLIALLTVRATLATQLDRHDQVLEDRRAAAGLLRGFDGQEAPVARHIALLAWMGLATAEQRAGESDAALEAAARGVASTADLRAEDVELCAAFLHDLETLRLDVRAAGRLEDVVTVAALSSDLATRLVEHDEAAYVAALGLVLVNEAAARANAGDLEAAGAVNEEAIRILQDLPDQDAGLTVALTNRAAWASREGRWEEAVAIQQQMLAGVRATRPASPEEVDRLNRLFITLVRSGRREEAERTIGEAIDVCRRLVDADPSRTVSLAVLVGNQANLRGELGRYDDALASSDEALALRGQLAASDPSPANDDGLAMALNNHSAVLRRLERYAEAAAAAARSVELRRRNADPANPNSVAALANSLNSHAEHLGRLGEGERAVELALEARDLFAGLPAPGAKTGYLRANQDTLGAVLAVAGRYDEAVVAAHRAVELGRVAAAAAPGEIAELASCLEALAHRLTEVGRTVAAESARAEAAQLSAAEAS
jgi:tetratricopeptide (TPR) repeat protein